MRGHWGIENRLHWGGSAMGGFPDLWRLPFKDVVFREDTLPLKHHHAASNLSLLCNIAINLARQHGYDSLTKAERFLCHNIPRLFYLLQ